MPEGDSIRIAAARIAPALVGAEIRSAASRWPSVAFGLAGRTVTGIAPVGKHLVLALDDGQGIRVHLGMRGRWRVVPPGQPVWGSLGEVSLRLDTDRGAVVCTGAPTVERLRLRELAVHPVLRGLGPDLLADDFDVDAAVARVADSRAGTAIEALRDQSIAAGIGNVYACEVLFVHRIHPFAPPASVDHERWRALFATARALMLRNTAAGGHRVTTPPGTPSPHWVYERGRRPCLRCGTPIASQVHASLPDRAVDDRDALPRRVYWCPRCQRDP